MKIRHASSIRNIHSTARRQSGAVLLLVTFSLLLLFGIAAFVLDVGRMYIVKSQLQNAADAGALKAALVLDTGGSLNDARAAGLTAAGKNDFLLGTAALDTTPGTSEVHVLFGSCIADSCFSEAYDATGNPNNYTFAKVTTAKSGISSFLAGVIGIATNASRAMAVAGRFNIDITPLAMCAIDTSLCPPTGNCGYDIGFEYRSSNVNPIGPGTPLDIDPMGSPTCGYSSASQFNPFVCAGKSAISGLTGSTVYTNPGTSTTRTLLDARFGVNYGTNGTSNCTDPVAAPPDTNVMQYFCRKTGTGGDPCKLTADKTKKDQVVPNWMAPLSTTFVNAQGEATQQSVTVTTKTSDHQGIVWSSVAPGTSPTYGRSTRTGYYPASNSPYDVPNTQFIAGKCVTGGIDCSINPAEMGITYTPKAHRRLMNMVIVDCQAAGGSCRPIKVLAVGQFFLTRQASLPTDKDVYVEFRKIVPISQFTTQIRLYR
ncbi:MAG TPA: pilus assembly protein TadG-related protein [Parasulfuritortus sp.]